ncbi:HEAT repeat domain-containing protein [Streptantibioticus cattleyicolor]|nr:HEAT repeat domain-containing protein [Streptantibioticus cattleyicolor]CCB71891.1 protein of unknown function [Streptantibioticus cattleyicolor NRRL 8057 = DSM 46488]
MSHRIVVRDSVTVRDLRNLADARGWRLAGHVPRDPANGVHFEIRWDAGGDTSVHYVEDELMAERYVVVAGEDAGARARLVAAIGAGVAVWPLEDLVLEATVRVYPAGRARAVRRLGVASPPDPDGAVIAVVEWAARDDDPRVREAAVRAMAYAGWSEYRRTLLELAEHDPDPEIARTARRVAAGLTRPADPPPGPPPPRTR